MEVRKTAHKIFFHATYVLCCCLAVICSTSCTKDAQKVIPLHSPVEDSIFPAAPPTYIAISPDKNATNVSINSGVVVRPSTPGDVSSFQIQSLILTHNDEVISGQFESSDSVATFIPDINLQKLTTYKVEVRGLARITPEKELQPFSKGFVESWTFTTAGTDPQYIMTRRSTQVTDFNRDGSKMIQNGNHLYLYGGWTGDGSFNDIYRSSGDLSTWEKMPDAPWPGRHTFGVGKLGYNIFVYGGDYNNDIFDVWKTKDGFNFSRVARDLKKSVNRRLLYGTCVHNNQLFVLGGQSSLDDLHAGLEDVWSSRNGLYWKKIADGKEFLGKNLAGSVASFNGKIYVVGGGYYGHPDTTVRWTNHVYSSADGITWTREENAPWIGRQYLDLCVWDNKLWMVAGTHNGNLSDIWYMQKDGTWKQFVAPNLFYPRHATAVATYNDQLVIACGNMHNECWVIERGK